MRAAFSLLFVTVAPMVVAATATFQLPAFPVPALGAEVSSIRLLRELHHAGLSGFDRLETADNDYALLQGDALASITSWLDATCAALNYDLRRARARSYDGTVFGRMLEVATSLGVLQQGARPLAIPIGFLACRRAKAWGQLPGDGANDVFVVFVTETGMMVYDPPTRQLCPLSDFPNKTTISRIRF
jgi:hypothetical protein